MPGTNLTREEAASRSTRENLELSRPLLEAEGRFAAPVVIVTHAFHAARVELLAAAAGYRPVVVAERGQRLDRRAYRLARELVAYLRASLPI